MAHGRRPLDGLQRQAVDDDLVDAADVVRELASGTSPRSVGANAVFVLARSALYLLPTFEPDRAIPPGNGRITSGTRPHRRGGGLGRRERRRRVGPEQDDVAAGDALRRAEGLLAGELAVHHRDPPVSPALEPLARSASRRRSSGAGRRR